MGPMNRIPTDIMEIAFEEGGPPDGTPVLLLHGWPDALEMALFPAIEQKMLVVGYQLCYYQMCIQSPQRAYRRQP
jgi:pimeloyl-ACP methyl ester carboxylesterase